MAKANRELMRDLNVNLVVNLVKASGPVSRADLARESKLSPATVSGIVARLMRTGILSEIEGRSSKVGRPPVLLRLNQQAAYVVGIKLTEYGLTTVVTNLGAEVIHSTSSRARLVGNPESAMDAIDSSVRAALTASGVNRKEVLGIGVGLPGIVDASEGTCRYSHILHWRGVQLSDPLRRRLRTPVWVDNDVNTLAVAEKWFGAGIGLRHFLTATIGRGVGLGIVANGEIYRGAYGGAGEFGHTIVAPGGPPCQCGREGCLEALVGEPALRKQASIARGAPVSAEDVVRLVAEGDRAVGAVLGEAGRQFGLALANLVTLFNPERLIVSGEGTRYGPAFFDPMSQAIREGAFAGTGAALDIVVQRWGDDAWAIGAATLVLRELYGLPTAGEAPRLALVAAR